MDDAVASVAAGGGRLVLIEGLAGVGKSRLLEEAARSAEAQGLQVGFGACQEFETDRPLGPLLDALGIDGSTTEQPEVELRQLISETHDDVVLAPSRFVPIIDRLVDLVEAMSSAGPRAIIVDDLHWADAATIRTLEALANRAGEHQLLVIAAFRPPTTDRRHQHLLDFRRRLGPVTLLQVESLSEAASIELAAGMLGRSMGARLTEAVTQTGGNPLFVVALAESFAISGLVEQPDGSAELPEGVLPVPFAPMVLDRLRGLGQQTWDLATVAAVLGVEFDPLDLSSMTGRTMTELLGWLRPLLEDGWLVESGPLLRFRHDLVRQAIHQDLPEGIRRGLHGDAARVLTERRAGPTLVASHLQLSARKGDQQAAETLAEAGRSLVVVNPQLAVVYLSRAIELVDDARQGLEFQGQLARAHVWAGEIDAASTLFAAVLDSSIEGPKRREIEGAYADSLFFYGRLSEAAELFGQLASEPSNPNRGLRRADLALCQMFEGQMDLAVRTAQQAVEESRETGVARGISEGLAVQSICLSMRGNHRRAIELATEAVVEADASPDLIGHRDVPLGVLAQAASFADDHQTALATLDRGAVVSRSIRMTWDQPILGSIKATELLAAGLWEDAVAEAEAVLVFSEESGVRVMDAYALACLSHVARRRGHLTEARNHVKQGLAAIEAGSTQGANLVYFEHAMTALWAGETSVGMTVASTLFDAMCEYGLTVRRRHFGLPLAAVAEQAGNAELAESIRGRVAELAADGERSPAERASGLLAAALLNDDPTPAREAVELLRPLHRGPELADALRDLSLVLAGTDEAEARKAADEAVELYRSFGASHDVAEVQGLFDMSANAERSPNRDRSVSGWAALTGSEQKVVALVSEGHTNAQIAETLFVSRRTVESHLHHVYTKLAMSSRVRLATEAKSRESGQSQ